MQPINPKNLPRPHVILPASTAAPQAFIIWGEEILDRIHNVGHDIEENVRQALNTQANTPSHSAVTSLDGPRSSS